MAKAQSSKTKSAEASKAPVELSPSLDHEIGKGLTPKDESSSIESEIAKHPKFDKFKKGVN